jgi:uncharacterized protein (DUF924 family)
MRTDRILAYWFGEADRGPVTPAGLGQSLGLWFGERRETDDHIRAEFAPDLAEVDDPAVDALGTTARAALALVVLLDQFPRNVHRGTPRAFATDARALGIMEKALAAGLDRELNVAQRIVFYLPLMHAEDRAHADRSLALYRALYDEAPAELHPVLARVRESAERHHRIVDRFGRYPHRNATLGRATTAEEEAFMAQPDSSYHPSQRA